MRTERGSVLVAALWALALLSLVAWSLASQARVEGRVVDDHWERVRRIQELKSLEARLRALVAESTAPWTSARDVSGWNLALGTGAVVSDETSRVNLNTASRAALERLTGSDEVAAAVLDWRDADHEPEPGGAESGFYQSLPEPYACRNGGLESLPEFLLIKGVTSDLFGTAGERATVLGEGKVNLNTAPTETLALLGLPARLAERIASYRAGRDGALGTQDDGVFRRISEAEELLRREGQLSEEEERAWTAVRTALDVRATAFRIELPGAFPGAGIGLAFETADRGRRSWREGF